MIWVVPGGLLLDMVVGDPNWLPHPVRAIGRLAGFLDGVLYRKSAPMMTKRFLGLLVVIGVVGVSYLTAWALVYVSRFVSEWLGMIVSALLVYSAIAVKSLREHSVRIADAVVRRELGLAREYASMMVSRDTASLDEKELLRAAVESVAENTVDGVIAPVFYAFLGGAPLAMAYKAVNTLDSMMGYKNDRYIDFGWAAAKLDDLANYIPARIAILAIALGSLLLGLDAWASLRVAMRDGRKHPSPNSGLSEAAFAGALGVRLGGVSRYGGEEKTIGFFGDAKKPLCAGAVETANRLVTAAALIFSLLGLCSIALIFG